MEDFRIVGEGLGDYLICNHCNERVERGIVSVSHHWLHCLSRKDGLIMINKENLGDDLFKKVDSLLTSMSINK